METQSTPVNSSDISKFLSSGEKILIVSDVEGLNPEAQINTILKHINENGKIIYNGDLLDYTGPTNFDLKNCCALKLLHALVCKMESSRSNVIAHIGNRELNKIKMLALNLLAKPGTNSKWWENGKSIEVIARNLLTTFNEARTNTENPNNAFWMFEDLNVINPFWTTKKEIFIKQWECMDKPNDKKSLKSRYDAIFGLDTDVGTMSAQNTLKYLPMELGINTDNDELKAAIVMTVYARLLDPELAGGNMQYGKIGNLDGYLYKYLTLARPASYGYIKDTLFLFAHGGITTDFVNGINGINGDGIDILTGIMKPENIEKLSFIKKDCPETKQSGGSKENNITIKIEQFNSKFTKLIKSLFDDYTKINTDKYVNTGVFGQYEIIGKTEDGDGIAFGNTMMILLSLCAPAHNHSIFRDATYNTTLSPIQAASPTMDSFEKSHDGVARIINVFSHIPQGIGYTFGKINNEMYFINTDFSNSCMKDTNVLDPGSYNSNHLCLYLTAQTNTELGFELHLTGNLDINTTVFKPIDLHKNVNKNVNDDGLLDSIVQNIFTDTTITNGIVFSAFSGVEKPKLDKINSLQLTFNYKLDSMDGFNGCDVFSACLNLMNKKGGPSELFYNGIVQINNYKYRLIVKSLPGFKKILLFIPILIKTNVNGGFRSIRKNRSGKRSHQRSHQKNKKISKKLKIRNQSKSTRRNRANAH